MITFQLANFGCRASQADGAALKRQLVDAGFREAAQGENSDIAVLNTCTVTAAADAEVRQIIRRIHRRNPDCRIVVTGCYAQRAPQEIATLEGVAWVIGNSHKHQIADLLRAAIPTSTPDDLPQVMTAQIGAEFHFAPAIPDDRTRPTLKVQDGCNARCSFCIIPTVRGPSRSLPPDAVVGELRRLDALGYREVVLSGINLGGYGRDLGRSVDFVALLRRILDQTEIARIRISSIELMDVTPELISLGRHEPRIAEHFHVPLQSGSDRILRLMNRRYWTAQYAERICAIREALPHAGIGADVMVGFPEETDGDHALTVEFIARLPFTYLHIFPYSARPDTPAATRAGQVEGRVKRERSRDLQSLIVQKRQTFLESQIGRTLSVLTLQEESPNGRAALSSNYLKVSIPSADLPANTLVDVEVMRIQDAVLYGYPRPCNQRVQDSATQTLASRLDRS